MNHEVEKLRRLFAKRLFAMLAGTLAVLQTSGALAQANGASLDNGGSGAPVTLTVGYQPYYAEAWSAVVLRGLHLEQRYLPAGSSVKFYIANRGLVLVHALEQGKIQMAYLGDVPAVLAASGGNASIVAVPGTSENQCSVLLVRPDAPADPAALIRWLKGKRIAVPQDSCSESFLYHLLRTEKIQPAAVYNQDPATIAAGFRAGVVDAAVVWQPAATHMESAGLARAALTGAESGWHDGAFLVMRDDLIHTRPDIVKDWLKAELSAERYLRNPMNAHAIMQMLTAQTMDYAETDLRHTLAILLGKNGLNPDFAVDEQAVQVLQQTRRFLIEQQDLSTHSQLQVQRQFAAALQRSVSTPAH